MRASKLLTLIGVLMGTAVVLAQDGPPTNNANIMTRVDTDNHLVVAAEIRDPTTTTNKAAVSASGALKVDCASGCSGGASFADNSAFTFGTTNINPTGYVFDDVAPNVVTENNAAAPRMSGNRVPYSILRDAAGNERGANITAGNALVVDGSAVTQPVSGTVTANQGTPASTANRWPVQITDGTDLALVTAGGSLNVECTAGCTPGGSFADNSVFTFGTTAINVSGFVFDDTAPNAVTENNAAAPRMSGNRVAYSMLRDAAGNERGANVNASNELLVNATQSGTWNIGTVTTVTGATITALPNEGQQTMANSISVAIASDQTAVPVSGTVNIGTFPDNEPFNLAQIAGTAASVNNGTADAGTLRVTIASNSTGQITANAGTNLNTSALNLEATQTGVATSLAIIDDWDETDRAKVNPIVGQAGVQGGAGASTATTQRVAIATDANAVSVTYPAVTGNTPASATVGVASAECLASNANRKAAFFVNTSNNTISIAESGNAAVLNAGITLIAVGGTYNMVPPFVTTGQVNCIASAASSNLSILEKQ